MSPPEVDTEEAIMEATYRAICDHGYAGLTMQDIADEFEKSKSLLHYHYDTKEELLVAFLEHLVGNFDQWLDELTAEEEPPEDLLRRYIDGFTVEADEEERTSLHLALLEMRSQAPHNPRIRELFRRSDRMARDAIAELVREGQAMGRFDPEADPEAIAKLCFSAIDGARARQITLGQPGYAEDVAEALYTRVIGSLLRGAE